MPDKKTKKIFLVDDDALFLKSMEMSFAKHPEFSIETFATGEPCLEKLESGKSKGEADPDIIILDYNLDSMDTKAIDGLEVLSKIKFFNSEIPVIMLSSQDKIEVAVNCMRHKAFDYIVKSETAFMRLEKAIETIFQKQKTENQLNWYIDRM